MPFVVIFVICMCGDVVYAICCLNAVIRLYRILTTNGEYMKTLRGWLDILVSLLLVSFSKKQGWYIVIVTCLIMTLHYHKKYLRQWLLLIVSIVFIFNILFEGIAYSILHVGKGSVAEMLSIPFQQTARYLKYNKDIVSDEEIEAISKVLSIDKITESYVAGNADAVKGTYHGKSTADLYGYFKAWWMGLCKAPKTYLAAFLQDNYEYFELKTSDEEWGYFKIRNIKTYYDIYQSSGWFEKYHVNDSLSDWEPLFYEAPAALERTREFGKNCIKHMQKLPIFCILTSIGFHFMLIIGLSCYFLRCKKKVRLLPQIFSLMTIVVCLISPIDGHFRYALPVLFLFPLTLSAPFIPLQQIKEEKSTPKPCLWGANAISFFRFIRSEVSPLPASERKPLHSIVPVHSHRVLLHIFP